MKGISGDVIPYAVEGMLDASGAKVQIFSEHMTGLDFYLDPAMIDAQTSEHVREVLQTAIATLDKKQANSSSTA
jgi:adenylate cyclase